MSSSSVRALPDMYASAGQDRFQPAGDRGFAESSNEPKAIYRWFVSQLTLITLASVAELVDALDLESSVAYGVRVRVPPLAPGKSVVFMPTPQDLQGQAGHASFPSP